MAVVVSNILTILSIQAYYQGHQQFTLKAEDGAILHRPDTYDVEAVTIMLQLYLMQITDLKWQITTSNFAILWLYHYLKLSQLEDSSKLSS